ncbi:hypothetical protein [Mucilaginibacter pedocola]|uniref:CHAT domain-containing protein n=1 Tax=Mucilaginibacter pedocola TaxID=1792845 RepID=A0A1S9PBE4_9SPHI|nr:hypothetical protein [Mucilaginibacter pedocola]OOQ58302.1 hypothetical protein BC343_11755 [Mucilaginibacter pedocola]
MENSQTKKMLILRACGSAGEDKECVNIKAQAELYGISVHDHCPKTNEELIQALNGGETFDYIYLASHGNEEGFGNEDGTIDLTWMNFGTQLCTATCMNEDCIILLSCCRGGLNQVAYTLFYCCEKIAYIAGPRQSLYPYDLLIGFNILLYNLEHRGIDPIVACEKIKAGTDIRFVCFDRLETESEPAYWMHIKRFNPETLNQVNEAKEKANETPAYIPPEVSGYVKSKIVP